MKKSIVKTILISLALLLSPLSVQAAKLLLSFDNAIIHCKTNLGPSFANECYSRAPRGIANTIEASRIKSIYSKKSVRPHTAHSNHMGNTDIDKLGKSSTPSVLNHTLRIALPNKVSILNRIITTASNIELAPITAGILIYLVGIATVAYFGGQLLAKQSIPECKPTSSDKNPSPQA